MTKRFIVAAGLLLTALAAIAQQPSPPSCAASEAHQFDFWIGRWTVTQNGKLAGHSHIERILGGCALLENWSSASGGAGKSLNFFDSGDGAWHQTVFSKTSNPNKTRMVDVEVDCTSPT